MNKPSKIVVIVCSGILGTLGMLISSGTLSADTSPSAEYQLPSDEQVIAFLVQSVDWYRHIYVERQVAGDPADMLFLEDNRPIVAQIARLSFEFARADAAMPATAGPSARHPAVPSTTDLARFIEFKKQNDDAIQKTNANIDALKKQIAAAHGAERRKLQPAMDEAQSRLELLQASSEGLNNLIDFVQNAGAGGTQSQNFPSAIDNLAQTVPEVNDAATALTKLPMQNAGAAATRTPDSGILGLAGEASALRHKLGVIDEKVLLTDNLAQSAQDLRTPMAGFINTVQSIVLSNFQSGDLTLLQQQKAKLDALTVQVKALSPPLLALDKQRVLLGLYKLHLGNWRNTAAEEYRQAWKKLIVRVLIVVLILVLLVGASTVSRRVTVRHIQDPNRRRIVQLGYHLVTLFAALVVAAFGIASELSSFATYFGLLTAGIAVALQNVIIASAGYLLLIGRGGIRIGDRVQISGTTGEVSDIGLLQFKLKEFDVEKQQFTGHVATFSNSFVFISPATGLVKLNPKERWPEVKEVGPEPDSKERGVGATS